MKAHRLLHHSTLGLRVVKKKRRTIPGRKFHVTVMKRTFLIIMMKNLSSGEKVRAVMAEECPG